MSDDSRERLKNAVKNGDLEMARSLIDALGLDSPAHKSFANELLGSAVIEGRTDIARLLVLSGADINVNLDILSKCDAYAESTPLQMAVCKSNVELVEMLLDCGADVEVKTALDETPLYLAVNALCMDTTKLIVTRNANINAATKDGRTPLHKAVEYDQFEIAEYLIDNGADVNCAGGTDDRVRTPLASACEDGREDLAKLLLSKGAAVDPRSEVRYLRPLDAAINGRHRTIVELLLRSGADVSGENFDGETALEVALRTGDTAILKDLLKSSPDLNSRGSRRCLKMALEINDEGREILELLLAHGFAVNPEDAEDPGFVRAAVISGDMDIVRDTLKHVSDVNARELRDPRLGSTLLHLAFENGHTDVVKALIERGADADAENERGATYFSWIFDNDDAEAFKFLVDHGLDMRKYPYLLVCAAESGRAGIIEIASVHPDVDVNATDPFGNTALHCAAHSWKYDVESTLDVQLARSAEILLCNGADVDALDNGGQTPLFSAVSKRIVPVVEVLLEHGADVNFRAGDRREMALQECCYVHPEYHRGPFVDDDRGLKIAKMLLNRGADVNAGTKDYGRSMLHLACYAGHVGLVELLLNYVPELDSAFVGDDGTKRPKINAKLFRSVVDIEARDQYGRSALLITLMIGYSILAGILLDYGADVEVECNKGLAALDYAAQNFVTPGKEGADYRLCVRTRAKVKRNFLKQMLKQKALGRRLSERILQAVDERKNLGSFYDECKAEVERMKIGKIGCNDLSFYDLVTMDVNHLAICRQNDHVARTLETSDYRKKYPIYRHMIDGSLSRARRRDILLTPSVRSFNEFFVGNELPDCMILEILGYLSNKDLENMMKARYEVVEI